MDPTDEERELVELNQQECAALLELERVGRLAVGHPTAGPDVIPVNFVLRDGDPIFRSHAGVVLQRTVGSSVSLQVDRFDYVHRTGWSMLVRGIAEVIEGDSVLDALDPIAGTPLESWVPDDRQVLIRVRTTGVTGRRIELHQLPLDGRGYL